MIALDDSRLTHANEVTALLRNEEPDSPFLLAPTERVCAACSLVYTTASGSGPVCADCVA